MQKSKKSLINLDVDELNRAWSVELELELIAGHKGLQRAINQNRVQKPGLRLIDTQIQLESGKIQILGRTEISYFDKLSTEEKHRVRESLSSQNVPCFIVTKGLVPHELFASACDEKNIPIFRTELNTGKIISMLNSLLDEHFAPFITVHGVLMDIHRLGVLILGQSGIGKSECALDLILRGSKLIADDIVEIRRVGADKLVGTGPKQIKHLMEIRGVGIINIKDLYGTASVLNSRAIDLVMELSEWDPDVEYDRLGIDENSYKILDVDVPFLIVPVSPGRNMATIVEVAVRNELLKKSGVHTAEKLYKEQIDSIKNKQDL